MSEKRSEKRPEKEPAAATDAERTLLDEAPLSERHSALRTSVDDAVEASSARLNRVREVLGLRQVRFCVERRDGNSVHSSATFDSLSVALRHAVEGSSSNIGCSFHVADESSRRVCCRAKGGVLYDDVGNEVAMAVVLKGERERGL